jgi:probable ATP-dependent RNA helicase DDX4
VKHVINFDMPKSIDEYVHRIGRTGRVGNAGKASSLYDPEQDSPLCGALKTILTGAGQPVPDFLASGGGSSYGGQQSFGGTDVRGSGRVSFFFVLIHHLNNIFMFLLFSILTAKRCTGS